MTQKEINHDCIFYMRAISDIGHNRELDMIMAEHFGANDVDYTLKDLEILKRGFELFDKADDSIPDFENLVLSKRKDI